MTIEREDKVYLQTGVKMINAEGEPLAFLLRLALGAGMNSMKTQQFPQIGHSETYTLIQT